MLPPFGRLLEDLVLLLTCSYFLKINYLLIIVLTALCKANYIYTCIMDIPAFQFLLLSVFSSTLAFPSLCIFFCLDYSFLQLFVNESIM